MTLQLEENTATDTLIIKVSLISISVANQQIVSAFKK